VGPKAHKIPWPTAVFLLVVCAVYLMKVVYAFLSDLSAAWSTGDPVIVVGAVIVMVVGPVALVWSANRCDGPPPTMASQLRRQDGEPETPPLRKL
jgi:hypothetical protein